MAHVFKQFICVSVTCDMLVFSLEINVREYKRVNQKWTIRETDNIRYTRRRTSSENYSTICVRNHYTQANANNVNNTWGLLQTTSIEIERNRISFLCLNRSRHSFSSNNEAELPDRTITVFQQLQLWIIPVIRKVRLKR